LSVLCHSTVECTSSCIMFALKVLNRKQQTSNLKPQTSNLKPQTTNHKLPPLTPAASSLRFRIRLRVHTLHAPLPAAPFHSFTNRFHVHRKTFEQAFTFQFRQVSPYAPIVYNPSTPPSPPPPPSLQRWAARAPTKFSGDWVLCLHIWEFGSRLFGL
jgi:hypothetical protein